MKKWKKQALVLLLSVAVALSGALQSAGSVSMAADGWETDAQEDTYQQYTSISNAYIASHTARSITFSWYSGGNNTGFFVYRKSQFDTEYEKIATVANEQNQTLTYKDSGFRQGILFLYKIVAYFEDSEGNITESSGVGASFQSAISKPKWKSLRRGTTKAVLKWKQVSGADGYEIYRKNAGGSYKKVKTITSGSTVQWTAKNLSRNKVTKFKIRAVVYYENHKVTGSFGEVKTAYSVLAQKIIKKFRKLQKQYPDGKYWNHVGKSSYNSSTITNKPCDHSKGNGLTTCNHYNCPNGVLGYQCYGFAWKMSDLLYGKNAKIKNFYSYAKCKRGDVIRYSGHSVIVTEKHKNYILVGECNAGNTCQISWGRKVYRSELAGAVYSRRYR